MNIIIKINKYHQCIKNKHYSQWSEINHLGTRLGRFWFQHFSFFLSCSEMGFTPLQSMISNSCEEYIWVYFSEYAQSPGFGDARALTCSYLRSLQFRCLWNEGRNISVVEPSSLHNGWLRLLTALQTGRGRPSTCIKVRLPLFSLGIRTITL